MPSNTPMTAAQLLALCDDMADAIDSGNPVKAWIAKENYRAARAASPVTLEEALCTEQARCAALCDGDPVSSEIAWGQYVASKRNVEAQGRVINARRLAGEWGAENA